MCDVGQLMLFASTNQEKVRQREAKLMEVYRQRTMEHYQIDEIEKTLRDINQRIASVHQDVMFKSQLDKDCRCALDVECLSDLRDISFNLPDKVSNVNLILIQNKVVPPNELHNLIEHLNFLRKGDSISVKYDQETKKNFEEHLLWIRAFGKDVDTLKLQEVFSTKFDDLFGSLYVKEEKLKL
ncbi:proliferating cell nuclear antigen [Acrasis kona]|uniref:Proliferating cell nuclear antigen n=1 Tax=Acrasis kona TaxID=1008807 RepID=A0AAW2ZK18_9EUKA